MGNPNREHLEKESYRGLDSLFRFYGSQITAHSNYLVAYAFAFAVYFYGLPPYSKFISLIQKKLEADDEDTGLAEVVYACLYCRIVFCFFVKSKSKNHNKLCDSHKRICEDYRELCEEYSIGKLRAFLIAVSNIFTSTYRRLLLEL
jgi:hypothetical protein